tara:strand:+ start:522 stop:839 length:318 start_codon:yes stop_codon:yes gene_type:complete
MTYRPLPEGTTIKESLLHGLGLHSTKSISKNTVLGISHIKNTNYEDDYIRTPLGGFINHSDTPNLKKISSAESRDIETGIILIKATKDILPGEELTLKYDLYAIE